MQTDSVNCHEGVVIPVAYKGSGKKGKIQGSSGRRSQYGIGGPGSVTKNMQNLGSPKKSKGQDSNKVHNTKGKNNHGRSRGWF